MSGTKDVECLILAAGFSRRFGANKLTHQLPNGQSLLGQTVALYQRVFGRVSVVVRASDVAIQTALASADVNIIPNPASEKGLSHSIITGIRSTRPRVGWLLALADMPYIDERTIRSLAACLDQQTIVVPRTHKGPGNPVGFGVEFRTALMTIRGDNGARSVVMANQDKVEYVTVEDRGIHLDIDAIEDIRH